jgi:capsular exopolysaccharide synthesis family protein
MSQDYQLSTNPQANGDFWTQSGQSILANAGIANGPGAAPGSSAPKAHSPMKKAHRLLRGRYPLAIFLAAAGAISGAVAGFLALPPKYESAGLVAVNPVESNGTAGETIIPMVTMFIQEQVGLLTSSRVATAALNDPKFIDAWQHAYGAAPLPTVADFIAAITPEHKGTTPLISVAFDDKKKEVAEAGAHALLTAYNQLHGAADEFTGIQKTIDYNADMQAKAEQRLNTLQQQIDTLGKVYGTTDLTTRDTATQQILAKLQDQLDTAKRDYENAVAAHNGIKHSDTDKEYIYEEIAAVPDLSMQRYLQQRETDRLYLDTLTAHVGVNSPVYKAQQILLAEDEKHVQDYAREYQIRHPLGIPLAPDDGSGANLQMLASQIQSLQKSIADESKIASDINSVKTKINDLRAEMDLTTDQKNGYARTIELLRAKQTLNQSVIVEDYGSEAVLAGDKRKLVAGLGFGFGGLIPLGLMLLYGLTENRFRFSDDASAADLAGVTLLGILPNLPDRLSDPQQAGIAAHCVHQIRTMLQISRSNDEPQVIAITSAASGDGKTSLTLALGLSYAACGARTLLIDCDLIAAGLTHRLNVNSTDGILEAVANRALLEYVRTTDIADVAILPVGTTHAHHASTLSPVALRRLLSEAKKHFDLIIVDTGPILGSIEASLVCAAADRTILAVARNQQRPLVEKSIAHLQAIGAQLAGVVFNRAQASDFERSMSGLALRSRPLPGSMNATPGQTSAAKAVAGSFKRAG